MKFHVKFYFCSNKTPYETLIFNEVILLDPNYNESYHLTPYPIKARNPVRVFTLDEVENASPTQSSPHNNLTYMKILIH